MRTPRRWSELRASQFIGEDFVTNDDGNLHHDEGYCLRPIASHRSRGARPWSIGRRRLRENDCPNTNGLEGTLALATTRNDEKRCRRLGATHRNSKTRRGSDSSRGHRFELKRQPEKRGEFSALRRLVARPKHTKQFIHENSLMQNLFVVQRNEAQENHSGPKSSLRVVELSSCPAALSLSDPFTLDHRRCPTVGFPSDR